MAVAGGTHTPNIGLKVYPFVVLRLPFVADFVGFAVYFRPYARYLLGGFACRGIFLPAQYPGRGKGVDFTKTDFVVHVLQAYRRRNSKQME